MGSLAGLLREKGFEVRGSDQNIYPPMSTELEKLGLKLYAGYNGNNLNWNPDLVIVGNAVSKTNPEVEALLRLKIPYLSMPQALSQFFISGKKSIVVAGTHGKTTTSAIMAHLLYQLGEDPSFFVGGVSLNFEKNYRLGAGKYFVIEGDEYDTAFFDKGPKFLHYQPYHTLITSVEFDHADIYRDLEHVVSSFAKLVELIQPEGTLTACSHYPRLTALLKKCRAKTQTYGLLENPNGVNPDWLAQNFSFKPECTEFDILKNGKKETRLSSPLPGRHNILNVLACYAFLRHLGFESKKISDALMSFKGVKRRQEIRGIVNDRIVMDDFAHHPTAVLETIDAVKKKYPHRPLWAIFEPRSNSSKRNIFQKDYAESFSGADQVILADVFMPSSVADGHILNVEEVATELQKKGIPAEHISGVENIVENVKKRVPPSAVILIMSNGGFGGIHSKLLEALKHDYGS